MKRIVLLLLILLITSSSCNLFGYSIYQGIESNMFDKYHEKTYLKTWVWHNGDIIKSWYDDVETANDSIKIIRRQQAEDFIKKCKRLEQ